MIPAVKPYIKGIIVFDTLSSLTWCRDAKLSTSASTAATAAAAAAAAAAAKRRLPATRGQQISRSSM